MMNSEDLSNALAHQLGEALHYTEEQIAVMAYGLFALLQTLLSISVVIVMGLLLGMMSEALIISFSIALLRKSSGGAHATSATRCLILGTIISLFGAWFSHFIGSFFTLPTLYSLGILAFIWSFCTIYQKAPVASPNKPIKSVSKQQKLKYNSLLVAFFYLIGVTLLLLTYTVQSISSLLIYSICLTLGMSWQVFTLTRLGHKFAHWLDQFLIHISNTIIKGK
ncbi:MAG: accessory gene regulator B family protein [Niameybacter sp.]